MQTNKWDKIHFYLVEDGISKGNKQELEKMLMDSENEVTFIEKLYIRGSLGVE